jgi:SAM-dependent methyltransferase
MSKKSLGEQNYEGFAYRYAQYAEDKAHNAHYERPNTLAILPDVHGQRVLDAGCGPGIYAEELINRGADVLAFDVTLDFVEIAKQRLGGKATVLQTDLTEPLDFAGEAEFDGVLCTLVLDYLEDWGPVFQEFYRVLKPGGWLLFSAGHPLGDWQWLKQGYPQYAESYFNTELFTSKWGGFGEPPVSITAYRRPLEAMLNPLIAAGLQLELVREAKPTQGFKDRNLEEFEYLSREPGFIAIRARKSRTDK